MPCGEPRRGFEDLEHLLTIVIGLAVGLWLARRAGWTLRWPWPAQPAPAPTDAAISPPPAPEPAPAEADTTTAAASLSARLHALEAVFSPLASNLAHPRELEDQPQFAEAVKLLQDPAVPLDTVMQYALGANWPLACAGLAALKRRADRSQRTDQVVAHFEKLYPWPIYFALDYLLAVEPRPPVGDPVAGAKDWWGDNLIVPGLFRDYFAERERLGDAPVFGSALNATMPRRRRRSGRFSSASTIRTRRRSCASSTASSAPMSTAPSSPRSAASGRTARTPSC